MPTAVRDSLYLFFENHTETGRPDSSGLPVLRDQTAAPNGMERSSTKVTLGKNVKNTEKLIAFLSSSSLVLYKSAEFIFLNLKFIVITLDSVFFLENSNVLTGLSFWIVHLLNTKNASINKVAQITIIPPSNNNLFILHTNYTKHLATK